MLHQSHAKRALSVLCLLGTVGVSGCSPQDEPTTHAPRSSTASQSVPQVHPRDPVGLLRKVAGCRLPEGATSGTYDVQGNLYADCTLGVDPGNPAASPTGRDFSIRLWSGPGRRPDFPSVQPGGSQRGEVAYVAGDTWLAQVEQTYPVNGETTATAFAPTLASQLGGRVVTPQ